MLGDPMDYNNLPRAHLRREEDIFWCHCYVSISDRDKIMDVALRLNTHTHTQKDGSNSINSSTDAGGN